MTYEEIKEHAEAGGWFEHDVLNEMEGKPYLFQIEAETLTPIYFYMKQYPKRDGYLFYSISSALKKAKP